MWVDSKRFERSLQVKLIKIFVLLTSVQCYYSVKNAFRWLILKGCFRNMKNSGSHTFSCQSLLLSTTVLNDNNIIIMLLVWKGYSHNKKKMENSGIFTKC